ncbi:MAG: pantoate--beta-alanine ligase [Nitrospirae bacterium]|nr:pantoate--beta-alanine ligase [Nitrospirota bacterium]MBI3594859.1 pantoate--beta-alanine ligase [Nitrospirota bacterium]
MKTLISLKEMQSVSSAIRKEGKTVGFVPTMGFLHDGHLSLIREASRRCDQVVVSIFVNPLQFGPLEDFKIYPQDLEGDTFKCQSAGVHFLFVPKSEEMIEGGTKSFIVMEEIMDRYCGASRPGHFQGVATIVLKLLNIVQPQNLFLGAKDFQQTVILKKLVHDFFLPVQVEVLPTLRESDGLAMSSRNSYLTREERRAATVLYRALITGREKYARGERSAEAIKKEIMNEIEKELGARVDYLDIVHPESLERVDPVIPAAVILLALWIGKTRLIDNLALPAMPS